MVFILCKLHLRFGTPADKKGTGHLTNQRNSEKCIPHSDRCTRSYIQCTIGFGIGGILRFSRFHLLACSGTNS